MGTLFLCAQIERTGAVAHWWIMFGFVIHTIKGQTLSNISGDGDHPSEN